MHMSKVGMLSIICLMSVTMVKAMYFYDDNFDSDWNDNFGLAWLGGSGLGQRGGSAGWSGRPANVHTGGAGFSNQFYNSYLFGDLDDSYYGGGGLYGWD